MLHESLADSDKDWMTYYYYKLQDRLKDSALPFKPHVRTSGYGNFLWAKNAFVDSFNSVVPLVLASGRAV